MRRAPHGRSDGELEYGSLLDAVRGLRWHARRASRIAVPGIHPSRVRGTSAEFTEYRAYRQGDDVRRIDWKLFARSDRAQVRISEERAVTPTFILLDSSASMAFPDGPGSKWVLARQLAVALVSIAHSGGDPAGIAVAGVPRAAIRPRTRRGVVADAIRILHEVKVGGSNPLAPAVIAAGRVAARIVILSDFLGDLDDTMRAARQLIAAGCDVYALHVIAAEEMDPPDTISVVTDPESAEVRRTLTRETRDEYRRAFSGWLATTASSWQASGAAYRAIVTGREPVSHAVRRIVQNDSAAPRAG